jgi:hypothetical protein
MLIKFMSVCPIGKIERTEFRVGTPQRLSQILRSQLQGTIRTLALIKG